MNYLENEFFLLAITFGIYFFAKLLQKRQNSVAKSDPVDYCSHYYLPQNNKHLF